MLVALLLTALVSASTPQTPGDGRVPVKRITPSVVRFAQSFLGLPMGTERYVVVDGRRCVFVVEPHYHPPGFPRGPHGWHKGVTAYELP